jgi:hypothetical protein
MREQLELDRTAWKVLQSDALHEDPAATWCDFKLMLEFIVHFFAFVYFNFVFFLKNSMHERTMRHLPPKKINDFSKMSAHHILHTTSSSSSLLASLDPFASISKGPELSNESNFEKNLRTTPFTPHANDPDNTTVAETLPRETFIRFLFCFCFCFIQCC